MEPNKHVINNSSKYQHISEELLLIKSIVQSSPIAIMVIDQAQKNILFYNEAFVKTWDVPENILKDSRADLLFKHMQTNAITPLNFPLRVTTEVTQEIKLNNNVYLEQFLGDQYIDGHFIGVVYRYRNISIEKKSSFDALTGLPNRLLLIELLQKSIANAKRNNNYIAVLFIDLDAFKAINDTFGHQAGDQVLKDFSQRLKKSVREEDIVSRLGGDEFIVVIQSNHSELKHVHKIIERFFKDIITYYKITQELEMQKKAEIIVTLSMGISFYPQDGDDAAELIQHADTAMYHAKAKGKNTFQFYNPEMSEQLLKRLQLEHGLRIALQKNELFLQYQPIINLKTNKIIAIEALIRWQHPTLGLIPPNELIPIAESSGTIFAIGVWVLKTACAQLKVWHNKGAKINVSINISECQIKHEDLVATIKEVLQEADLEAKYLEIEIAEKVFLSHGDLILTKLYELKELGIKINIDNFGSCYLKFGNVKKFPIDSLKIDRTLFKDPGKNPKEHAGFDVLVKAIATIAMGLNLHVIAEGIETKEQLAALNTIFTDEAQGYFFAKPGSAEDITQLLQND